MGRAEAGSVKAIANNMKSKGLQRLRWWCEPCQKQCRDENGFKCHTESPSHVQNMNIISRNSGQVIEDYSKAFMRDFIQLLRTTHGTKQVHLNNFYQQYIANKEHVHMNSTKWKSLTQLAKHLGQEGICRVEELEKGLHISWIDNSPEAVRRQQAELKRERADRGDGSAEHSEVQKQVARAHEKAKAQREKQLAEEYAQSVRNKEQAQRNDEAAKANGGDDKDAAAETGAVSPKADDKETTEPEQPVKKPAFSFKLSAATKAQEKPAAVPNPLATFRNPLAKPKGPAPKRAAPADDKPASERDRIMRDELAKERQFGAGGAPFKKQRLSEPPYSHRGDRGESAWSRAGRGGGGRGRGGRGDSWRPAPGQPGRSRGEGQSRGQRNNGISGGLGGRGRDPGFWLGGGRGGRGRHHDV